MGKSPKMECPDCGLTVSRKNMSKHYRKMHPGKDPYGRMRDLRSERPMRTIEESPRSMIAGMMVAGFVAVILIIASLLVLSFVQDGESSPDEPVHAFFVANDGAVINGTFYPSEYEGSHTIYLVHDVGSDRSVWGDYARKLQADGYNVMAYDMRGHGESSLSVRSADIVYDWKEMDAEEMGKVELDLRAAYDWVQGTDENGNPNTDADDYGAMIGIGRGGLLTMNQASRMARQMLSATILSPKLDAYNLDVEQLFEDFGDVRPVLLVASEDDTVGKLTMETILERKEADGEENGYGIYVHGDDRGIDLLEDRELRDSIDEVLERGWETV